MFTIDFETYSEVDLKTEGAYRYAVHPSTEILCVGYSLNYEPSKIWYPGDPLPEDLTIANRPIYAHNAIFEHLIWQNCGERAGLGSAPMLEDWVDVMALCARYGYPMSLDAAGKTLDLDVQKDKAGKGLIKKCCIPGGSPEAQDYIDLGEYCKRDVDTTNEIVKNLPHHKLTDLEQEVWVLTQKMNKAGAPIDMESVKLILARVEEFRAAQLAKVPEITGGEVRTPNQVVVIRKYCAVRGIILPNLTANTVEATLEKELPDDVRELLEVRQVVGKTSTKKLDVLAGQSLAGRFHGGLVYYGASTGRWAGRGFQFHNLPRVCAEDPEAEIQKIRDYLAPRVLHSASSVLRALIMATEGHSLIVSDYSSIENRVIAWLAKDEKTLQLFREGKDQYKDMATSLFNTTYEEVTKDQRQKAKPAVLGCGYGMGKVRFQAHAATFGMELTVNEADRMVKAYRKKYNLVVNLWYRLQERALFAIRSPGQEYTFNGCDFKVIAGKDRHTWLRIMMPSGRSLLYRNPSIGEGKYGAEVQYLAFNQSGAFYTSVLTPGRITENIVQALARDILAHGKLNIMKRLTEVRLFMSVHDEAVGEVRKEWITNNLMKVFNKLLCDKPKWAEGLPLDAEGYIAKRYRKG